MPGLYDWKTEPPTSHGSSSCNPVILSKKVKAAHACAWTAFGELLGLACGLTVCDFLKRRSTRQWDYWTGIL